MLSVNHSYHQNAHSISINGINLQKTISWPMVCQSMPASLSQLEKLTTIVADTGDFECKEIRFPSFSLFF
jgi:hypothetical protein